MSASHTREQALRNGYTITVTVKGPDEVEVIKALEAVAPEILGRFARHSHEHLPPAPEPHRAPCRGCPD